MRGWRVSHAVRPNRSQKYPRLPGGAPLLLHAEVGPVPILANSIPYACPVDDEPHPTEMGTDLISSDRSEMARYTLQVIRIIKYSRFVTAQLLQHSDVLGSQRRVRTR